MANHRATTKEKTKTQALFYEQIYALVREIPRGKVATYGQIASLLGREGHARQVGYALYRVDTHTDIPWHRVLNAKGMISESPQRQGSDDLQRLLLEQEQVIFNHKGQINLHQYRWHPPLVEGLMAKGV
ncbi:MAG: MGMT family protein [Acaryochloridaceae cyanobacterium SU_2_1]|nr:MGMT family protein [Acaryochloridaceae cyanobacterium SU_2_1]